MIYVYAIVDQPELPALGIDGLEDVPVRVISYRGVGAVVSPLSTNEVMATEANLWRHEAVLDALMADRALLPVRFGTIFADEGSVQHELAARYESLVAGLDRVRGCVELALRVLWDGVDTDAPTQDLDETGLTSLGEISSGHQYMAARLREYRDKQKQRERAQEYAGTIHSALSDMADRSTRRLLPTPRVLMTAAYLVKSAEVAGFQQKLEELRLSHAELRFFCTGPWPPFTFADEEECDNDNPWEDASAFGPGPTG